MTVSTEYQDHRFTDIWLSGLVQQMMARHHIGSRSCARELMQILNIGYSQAHRKMTGSSSWLATDLQQIACYFNESIHVLLSDESHSNVQDAVITIGFHDLCCRIWVQDKPVDFSQSQIVAIKEESHWRVVDSSEVGNKPSYAILKIEIIPQSTKKYRLALLDDDKNFCETMGHLLENQGFLTSSYSQKEAFSHAIQQEKFDALVIDWVIDKQADDTLIRNIRNMPEYEKIPIVLLTGNSTAYAATVAKAIRQLNLIYIGKPTLVEIISAQLRASLGT